MARPIREHRIVLAKTKPRQEANGFQSNIKQVDAGLTDHNFVPPDSALIQIIAVSSAPSETRPHVKIIRIA